MAKKKRGLDVMIALLGKKGKGEDDMESEGGSPKEEAAQRLIDAVKGGNARKVSLALEEHYALCSGEDDDLDDDMDEEEGDEDYA